MMPHDIHADVAYLAGAWVESVLYGMHIILFVSILKIFLNKSYVRGREVSSFILLAYSTVMFSLSTTHTALLLHEILQGFVYQRDSMGGPTGYYRNNVFPPRKAVYIINTLLGDSLLVWRIYVIWGYNWVIALPSFLFFIGTTICGIRLIVADVTGSTASVFTPTILAWVTSTFVLTIVTQITTTVLIAGRIYWAARLFDRGTSSSSDTNASSYRNRKYMTLVWLVVESGAVYTAAALIQLITYLEKMNAGVIMEFVLSQVSAMAPLLIVVRVGLGLAHDGSATSTFGSHRYRFNGKVNGLSTDDKMVFAERKTGTGTQAGDATNGSIDKSIHVGLEVASSKEETQNGSKGDGSSSVEDAKQNQEKEKKEVV